VSSHDHHLVIQQRIAREVDHTEGLEVDDSTEPITGGNGWFAIIQYYRKEMQ
jgi:hypothetical protein